VEHAAPKRRVGSVVFRRFLHKNLVSKTDLLVQASQYPKSSGFLHESISITISIVGLLIGCKALRNWSGFKPQKSKQIDLYLMHIPTSLKAWHYIPFRRLIIAQDGMAASMTGSEAKPPLQKHGFPLFVIILQPS
jgi:hypothetical protein